MQSDMEGQVGIGAIRSCHVAGFGPVAPGVVREKLIDYDPEHMSVAYESVAGLPSFIRRVVNRLSVQPISQHRCRVCSHAAFELRGPVSLVGPLFIWRVRSMRRACWMSSVTISSTVSPTRVNNAS